MKNIKEKLGSIARRVYSISGIPLFVELPISELEALNEKVLDEKSLKIGLIDFSNLLDRINKGELDKYNGIGKSTGSRDCLIKFLKKLSASNHNKIDEYIDKPIGMILLLRGYFTHRKNDNIKKAEKYFDVKFPIDNYEYLWAKILFYFNSTLDIINELLDEKENPISRHQENINEDIATLLRADFISKHSSILNNPSMKKILLYLYIEKEAPDCDMAIEFRYDIAELRELLLPLVPSLLFPKYINSKSTMVSLTSFGKSIVKQLYLK